MIQMQTKKVTCKGKIKLIEVGDQSKYICIKCGTYHRFDFDMPKTCNKQITIYSKNNI